jgi:aryl-phospho-beta-D-glucosidase BglC (GH1 family)
MTRRFLIAFALIVATTSMTNAQNSSTAWKRVLHLQHGINLSSWFAQSGNYAIPQLSSYTTPTDIEHIKQLGFDHVRIPVDPAIFRCNEDWDACEHVQFLDQVIKKALDQHLAVILVLYPDQQFTHEIAVNPEGVDRFIRVWGKIAEHYGKMDAENIFLEPINEIAMYDSFRWSGILDQVIPAIRKQAPLSTIIVSGPGYADIWDLILLPHFSDPNLIYSFHFYEPHIFTHQGADWASPIWVKVPHLPFPSSKEAVASYIENQDDQNARWQTLQYGLEHWDAGHIAAQVDFAAAWGRQHNVPLICDEFGVYRKFVAPEDRERWLTATRKALEQDHIGWSMWDYQGGFGVVYKDRNSIRDDDVALRSLGLKK